MTIGDLRKRSGRTQAEPAPASAQEYYDSKAKPVARTIKRTERPTERPVKTSTDVVLALIILALAVAVRFIRLDKPKSVVFDEVHFGKFTNWYLQRKFFFDIHPPLAKLTFAGIGKLFEYRPLDGEFKHIGQRYHPDNKYYVLRAVSAAFGSFVPMFGFLSCRVGENAPFVTPCVLLPRANLLFSSFLQRAHRRDLFSGTGAVH